MKMAPLTPQGFEKYHYVPVPKNNQPEQDYKGIEFGPIQIYNIFQNLGSLIDTESVLLPEDSTISFIDPDHLKNSYGEPESFMWFTADIPAVVAATPSMSWYQKLSAAASSTLLQMVWLSLELKDIRGRKQMFNTESKRKVVMSVQTEPWDGDDQFPPFPIGSSPLIDWVRHFEETATDFATQPPLFQDKLTKRFTAISEGVPPEVSKKDLETWATDGDLIETTLQREMVSAAAQDGHDISEIDLSHFTNVASIPLARIHPPVWTPFLTKFAYANLYGKSVLMNHSLEAEERRMTYLIQNCQTRLSVLEKSKAELRAKTESLESVKNQLEMKHAQVQQTETEVRGMKRRLDEASQDPEVADFIRQDYEAKIAESGQPPYQPFGMQFAFPPQLAAQLIQQQQQQLAAYQQQFGAPYQQQQYGSSSMPFGMYLFLLLV
jgi:hypothetical protein